MSSAAPPTYYFNGINYNSQFYASGSSTINSALYVTTTTAQTISGQKTLTAALIENGGITGTGDISITGDISTTSTGTITSAGLLTASNGFTVSSGTVTLPTNSIASTSILNTSFVDLTTTQSSIAGAKTFTNNLATSGTATITSAGLLTASTTTDSTSTSTGGFVCSGGIGVAKSIYSNGKLNILNNATVAAPSIGISGGNGDRIILTSGTVSTYPLSIGTNTNEMWFSSPASGAYKFYTNGTNTATLSSAGLLTVAGGLTVSTGGTVSFPSSSVASTSINNTSFVDMSTTQSSIGGAKTFTSLLTASAGLTVSGAVLNANEGLTVPTGKTLTVSTGGTISFPTNSVASTSINNTSFVDMSTTQSSIAGAKTFTAAFTASDSLIVGSTTKVNPVLSVIGKYGTASSGEFDIGIANIATNFAADSTAGDTVLRNSTPSTNNILITNNSASTSAIKIDTANNVTILNTTATTGYNNGALVCNGGIGANQLSLYGDALICSNTNNRSINNQGLWLQWNRSGGASYIINQKGGGTGGISFGESTIANVYTENMFLNSSGNLNVVGQITADTLNVGSTAKVNPVLQIVGKYGTSSSTSFQIGVANNTGNYASDAVGGDSVIRNGAGLTNNILITNNPSSTSAIKIDTANNVTFQTTAYATTPTAGDNSTKVATTAFVNNAFTSGSTTYYTTLYKVKRATGTGAHTGTMSGDYGASIMQASTNGGGTTGISSSDTIFSCYGKLILMGNVSSITANGTVTYSSGSGLVFISNGGQLGVSSLGGSGNRPVYSDSSGLLTNTASDRKLKTNVVDISYGLDVIKKLRPIAFNWIDTEKRGEQKEIGFIAQEVQELVPEVIGINNDETLSLDYAKLVAVLAKGMQEQQTIIENQQKTIDKLTEFLTSKFPDFIL